MLRTRFRRRALSANDTDNISEAKKSDIISKFTTETPEKINSGCTKYISECSASFTRSMEIYDKVERKSDHCGRQCRVKEKPGLPNDEDRLYWNIREKNQQMFLENQLKCSICLELYVKATVAIANEENKQNEVARRCGHTFCEYCINTSMKNSVKCPLCQSKIILTTPNHALESFINQFVETYFSNEAKTARANLLQEREENKNQSIAEAANRAPRRAINVPPRYGSPYIYMGRLHFDADEHNNIDTSANADEINNATGHLNPVVNDYVQGILRRRIDRIINELDGTILVGG